MTLLPGETVLRINGETRVLRLTLGALAEIEQSIGGGDFERLRERLKSPSVSDLLLILHALIAGGGERVALDILKAGDIDFRAAAAAIGEAFRGLGSSSEPQRGVIPCALQHPSAAAQTRDPGAATSAPAAMGPACAPQRFTLPDREGGHHHSRAFARGSARDDAQNTGDASPPKPPARRSPGKRGSAPESSQ